MASMTVKVKNKDGKLEDKTFDFPWFNEDLGRLLGNPRPSTLQDIEKNDYWKNLFRDWCRDKGAGFEYDAWEKDEFGAGDAREALKAMQVQSETKGLLGIREAFRADLGSVKTVCRVKREQEQGLGQEVEDTFFLTSDDAEE